MNHRLVIEELVAQHTKALASPAAKGRGLRELVNEWHNGASAGYPAPVNEFPREFELAEGRKEEARKGRWKIACALYTVEISIDPGSKKEKELFLRAVEKLPALATARREVHWPLLREALGFTVELTFRAMALGQHFGAWVIETPLTGYCGAEAYRLAQEGMVLVRPVPKKHEGGKLIELFSVSRR